VERKAARAGGEQGLAPAPPGVRGAVSAVHLEVKWGALLWWGEMQCLSACDVLCRSSLGPAKVLDSLIMYDTWSSLQ
jgi:hypothetical protein